MAGAAEVMALLDRSAFPGKLGAWAHALGESENLMRSFVVFGDVVLRSHSLRHENEMTKL